MMDLAGSINSAMKGGGVDWEDWEDSQLTSQQTKYFIKMSRIGPDQTRHYPEKFNCVGE